MAFSSPSGIGSVSDLHFIGLDPQAKFIAIDEQSKDNVMQLDRPGKADRLPHQACDPGASREVLPLDLLRVALTRLVLIRIEMTRVGAPIVRIIPRDAKRFQQGLELEKHLILAAPQDVRQHSTTAMIYRVPEPSRRSFRAHKRPHLVHFGLLRQSYDDGHLIWF
jgi:hypothetical protein